MYTIADTPHIKERIDGDMARIVKTVRAADPAVCSIILTGGFARGEGAVLNGVPQNDYDIVATRRLSLVRPDYGALRKRLDAQLGVEVDIAPVAELRLPWARRSIFWYETALRGRVVWGKDVLPRLPVRTAQQLARTEPLRLLVNRAAGLLLATTEKDAARRRIQASKAILAALDVHLLCAGRFAPSQRERWAAFHAWRVVAGTPQLEPWYDWFSWAYRCKVDPGRAREPVGDDPWQMARRLLLDAVPLALRHAGLATLDAYARRDHFLDALVYARRSGAIPGAKRFQLHPTARLRVATLRILEQTPTGAVEPELAGALLSGLAAPTRPPLQTLAALRGATLQ